MAAGKATDFTARLGKMNSEWKKSKETHDQMFTDVPDGVYIADLQSMVLKESSTGNLRAAREFLINGGEHDNVQVYDGLNLESEVGMAFFRHEVDSMGYEVPESATEIPALVKAITKDAGKYRIQVSHSGDFVNVKVLEPLDEDGESTGEAESETGGEAGGEGDMLTRETIEEMDADELAVVVESYGLDVKPARKLSVYQQKVVEAIDEAGYLAESEEGADEGEEGEEAGEGVQQLIDFMTARDLDLPDEQDEESLIKEIGDYEWDLKGDELTEEEVILLQSIDVKITGIPTKAGKGKAKKA